ncbi:sulfotransferase [Pseudolysobacter antarcticus]|uniref:Sulfotransferase n=1 Tax=Pseudolysobacter antarcticus TaxID=2511995 RepID=A0A411HG88_9GAMM|nr:sulfotransferase [Pseudolysobacter antarcticus]QBB69513.1 sulfotransferase [Pseudolysobacter antarcticus]
MSHPETAASSPETAANTAADFIAEYARDLNSFDPQAALAALQARLGRFPPADWIHCAQALIDGGALPEAADLLTAAGKRFPDSVEVGYWLANVFRLSAHDVEAEALLRALIQMRPDFIDSRFLLAQILKEQGKLSSATSTLLPLLESNSADIETTLAAVKFLDQCGRAKEAAEFCEKAIANGMHDTRLYAHAGRYAVQLGQFDLARERYLHALHSDDRVREWHIPQALSSTQRYASSQHPDFALFENFLQHPDLSNSVRASTLFALGKAYDDIGDYAEAASHLSEANALIDRDATWSDADWQQAIDEKIRHPIFSLHAPADKDWTPVFIVGLPRSGTTLVEERLMRHADVTGRGELPWIPFLAQQFFQQPQAIDAGAIRRAAAIYSTQVRQDDPPTHWYIDKQPLNFLHLDLIAALFPNAKIIYCERNLRDTALSIWSQNFAGDEGGFAYDFANIAGLARGCARIMAHWRATLPIQIHTVDYAQMVQAPEQTMTALQAFLGLPAQDLLDTKPKAESSIATSSMWQARQPIYHRSINRWQAYAPYLPKLVKLFPDGNS